MIETVQRYQTLDIATWNLKSAALTTKPRLAQILVHSSSGLDNISYADVIIGLTMVGMD